MIIPNQLNAVAQPKPRPSPTWPELLTDRRFTAVANVLVFTPYAVYLARGKRPPGWLIAASLAYLAVTFFEDMRYLIQGEQIIEAELLGELPRQMREQRGELYGNIGHPPPPPWRAPAPQTFNRYRVNR